MGTPVIRQYGLEFGPRDSSMYFILPDGKKVDGLTKYYSGSPSFLGWRMYVNSTTSKQETLLFVNLSSQDVWLRVLEFTS